MNHCSALAKLLVALLAGTLSAQQTEAPKPQSPNPPTPTTGSETKVASVDPNKYLIGPEDVLFIRTWREQDWTLPAVVRPDGKITIPLVGEVQAAGLTPLQLVKSLTEVISKYVNNPDINVFVQDVRSKKYYIDGQVNRPGLYPLVGPVTILEALSICGGFRDFANQKNITILRGTKTFKFNYNEVIKGKHLEQNIQIESGDHIIVK